MASNGLKMVEITPWDVLKFSWWQTSQSIEKNTTTIGWKLELIATSYGYINSTAIKTYLVVIDGTEYKGENSVGINNNSTLTLASGSQTIEHDADGQRQFAFAFYQDFNLNFTGTGWIGNEGGVGTGTLNQIPRASQPSCITWPNHTQNVGYFGDTISIHMNSASQAFTHTVRYTFGPSNNLMKGTIDSGVVNGTTWKIPLEMMNLLPSSREGSGLIYVDTYSGSKLIGTKYCGFTAKVPEDVKPTVTFTLEDITGWDKVYGSPVQGLSKIKVTATGKEAYKSPIDRYDIFLDYENYRTASATSGPLEISGDSRVVVTVYDDRGRWGRDEYTMKVQHYEAPIVEYLRVHRCDVDGESNDYGEFVKVEFLAYITWLNGKNTAKYTLRYKKSTETSYTSIPLDEFENRDAVSSSYVFPAEGTQTYDVQLEVKDSHFTGTKSTSASTALTLMNFGADGTSIGLLKAAERPKAVDVGGDIYMNGHALYGAHGLEDSRNMNYTPEYYMTTYRRGTVWEFKALKYIEFTDPSTPYGPVHTIIPWGDSSGGYPIQEAYEGGKLWRRVGIGYTSWGPWQSEGLSAYPIDSIYISYNHIDPGTLFGGRWIRITDGFLWASRETDIIGQTGGEKTHKLTVDELPSHSHGSVYSGNASGTKTHAWLASGGSSMAYGTVATGGGKEHNNMPPYIQVSIWRRWA